MNAAAIREQPGRSSTWSKESQMQRCVLYDNIYLKFKEKEHWSLVKEVKTVAALTGKGHDRAFRGPGNPLSRVRP